MLGTPYGVAAPAVPNPAAPLDYAVGGIDFDGGYRWICPGPAPQPLEANEPQKRVWECCRFTCFLIYENTCGVVHAMVHYYLNTKP